MVNGDETRVFHWLGKSSDRVLARCFVLKSAVCRSRASDVGPQGHPQLTEMVRDRRAALSSDHEVSFMRRLQTTVACPPWDSHRIPTAEIVGTSQRTNPNLPTCRRGCRRVARARVDMQATLRMTLPRVRHIVSAVSCLTLSEPCRVHADAVSETRRRVGTVRQVAVVKKKHLSLTCAKKLSTVHVKPSDGGLMSQQVGHAEGCFMLRGRRNKIHNTPSPESIEQGSETVLLEERTRSTKRSELVHLSNTASKKHWPRLPCSALRSLSFAERAGGTTRSTDPWKAKPSDSLSTPHEVRK